MVRVRVWVSEVRARIRFRVKDLVDYRNSGPSETRKSEYWTELDYSIDLL